jgi:hypothetical protein
MITSKSIAGIALKAARLLSTNKIDPATATRISTVTGRALDDLREGKALADKSVAELIQIETMLTLADRG